VFLYHSICFALALAIGPSHRNPEYHTKIIEAVFKTQAIYGTELKLLGRVPVKKCVWIFKSSNSDTRCCYPEDRCNKYQRDMQGSKCRTDLKWEDQPEGCTLLIPDVKKEDEGEYNMQEAEIILKAETINKTMNGTNLKLKAKGAKMVECQWTLTKVDNQTCCYSATDDDPEWQGFNQACRKTQNEDGCRGAVGKKSERTYPKVATVKDTCSLVIENVQGEDVGIYLGFLPHDSPRPQANYSVTFMASYCVDVVFDECPETECYFVEFVTFLVISLVLFCCCLSLCLYSRAQLGKPLRDYMSRCRSHSRAEGEDKNLGEGMAMLPGQKSEEGGQKDDVENEGTNQGRMAFSE